jgi:hypothetical protein
MAKELASVLRAAPETTIWKISTLDGEKTVALVVGFEGDFLFCVNNNGEPMFIPFGAIKSIGCVTHSDGHAPWFKDKETPTAAITASRAADFAAMGKMISEASK